MSNAALSPRVVVLTGASSGIGRATAHAFARQGARLVLAARERQALDVVAGECVRFGGMAHVVPTDVTDARAVQALAVAAIERFGAIDVWVNNVGVGAVGRFDATPMAAHRRIVETNLLGHMHGAHAVLPHWRERGRGVLINMISIGGQVPVPYASAYVASKFALRGFSESLRAELSDLPQVHVCEVYPTFVDTPGMSHGANFTGRRLRPAPPLLDPRAVARVVVRLARSPRSRVSVGSVSVPGRLAHAIAPDLLGTMAKRVFDRALKNAQPARLTSGNLYEPSLGSSIDGGWRRANRRPVRALAIAAFGVLSALAFAGWARRDASHR